eukprot:TRINITY_DN3105_c0_g1_i1.p1 TRINITY_DN3105_c0_g1~~TRINITY_DN3105_c0_g1_i1.p1  ORF type:complete len:407 (-),score=11.28 TRINITY_DN3105_c0_g1_i1:191-1411(-)
MSREYPKARASKGINLLNDENRTIKRWNFAGQRRSHGNSKAHRKVGSIGQRTTPAKVWKGKKMPGRMGGESSTVQNMIVIRVDCPRSLIYLKGAIPGTIGSCVYIKDAVKRIAKQYKRLQYPTFVPEDGVEYPDVETIRESKLDPSDVYRHENNIEGDNFDEEEEDEDDVVVDETGTICADDDLEQEDLYLLREYQAQQLHGIVRKRCDYEQVQDYFAFSLKPAMALSLTSLISFLPRSTSVCTSSNFSSKKASYFTSIGIKIVSYIQTAPAPLFLISKQPNKHLTMPKNGIDSRSHSVKLYIKAMNPSTTQYLPNRSKISGLPTLKALNVIYAGYTYNNKRLTTILPMPFTNKKSMNVSKAVNIIAGGIWVRLAVNRTRCCCFAQSLQLSQRLAIFFESLFEFFE